MRDEEKKGMGDLEEKLRKVDVKVRMRLMDRGRKVLGKVVNR